MNKQGFTLLEVSLFFAVSGLLALVAFAGLAPRLRNVRFTDAVRTLESTTQRQLSDFQAGVNLRDSGIGCTRSGSGIFISTDAGQQVGAAADCVINGRFVVFEETQTTFYPIVSLRKAIEPCASHAAYGKIFCHSPYIVGLGATKQVSEYRNGARLSSGEVKLTYIQDPEGTNTNLMQYTPLGSVPSGGAAITQGDIGDLPAEMCLELSGRTAQISYTNSSLKPEINFEGCAI